MNNIIKCLKKVMFSPIVVRGLNINQHCINTLGKIGTSRLYSSFSPLTASGLAVERKNTTSPNILTQVNTSQLNFMRTYKVKNILQLRCDQCYFIKRKGRWFVECTKRTRHKQMQKQAKRDVYRDDYSEGDVKEACFWKYRHNRWYERGNNEFARMDWLGDRLGKEV